MAKKLSVTPRGTFVFPWLNKPDTKWKEEGEYRVKLRLPSDSKECKALVKKIDKAMAESLAAAREKADTPKKKKAVGPADAPPYTIETDDDDNETGYTLFTFKAKASGVSKKTGEPWKRKIPLFDAAGTPLKGIEIGGGTEGKISYEIRPYYTVKLGAGVTLALEGVQILKLVEYGSKDADSLGFEDESDEFPVPDEDTEDTEAEDEEETPAPKKSKAKKSKPPVDDDDDDEDEDDEDEDDF